MAGYGPAQRRPRESTPLSAVTSQRTIRNECSSSPVTWTVESASPSHAPAFTAAADTRLLATGTPMRGQGSEASKAAARATATLLVRLDAE